MTAILVLLDVQFSYHIISYLYLFMHLILCTPSIMLIHASHTCITVTEPSEMEPVDPTESVEPESRVQFVVEPKANQGKQLSMIPCSYLI